MDLFRVRLNCVDHYQATPLEFDPPLPKDIELDQEEKRSKVPIIRIFGATETGQKVCAHVHGAFPYLYIQYMGALNSDDVDAYVHQLHLSIDHALAVSYRRNMYDGKTRFVAHITLVKGIPFYGYHVGYDFFLKIYMLNPMYITRLADLFRQGAIMKRVIQPYESHMQYLAQWMCDYNLYGCAYVDCKKVRFRAPVPEYLDMTSTTHQWHDRSIAPSLISDSSKAPRQSHCSIEVDVSVQHILNRDKVKPRSIHHNLIECLDSNASDEKLVHSMAGLWRDETRRRKARLGMTESDGSSPFPPEVLVSVSADPRNTEQGGWIHEEEYREKLQLIATSERDSNAGEEIQMRGLIGKSAFEDNVTTSLDSVEDLYPKNLARASDSQLLDQVMPRNSARSTEPEVDESRLLSFDDDDFPYASDEEVARELDLTQKRRAAVGGDPAEQFHHSKEHPIQNGIAQTSRGELDSFVGKDAQGPTSSTELEDLGIRNTGDLNYMEEDVVEVPNEFASTIVVDQSRSSLTHQTNASKRQKLSNNSNSGSVNVHQEILANGDVELVNKQMEEPGPCGGGTAMLDPMASECTGLASRQVADRKSSSQEGLQTIPASQGIPRMASNMKLAFSVVKDPQDPNTVHRLSQRSNSQSKPSQVSMTKSVSFEDSDSRSPTRPSQNDSTALDPLAMPRLLFLADHFIWFTALQKFQPRRQAPIDVRR